ALRSAAHFLRAIAPRHPRPFARQHGWLWLMLLLFLSGLTVASGSSMGQAQTLWCYVPPAAGEAMEHAPFHPLLLTQEKPGDLIEVVPYRGTRRLYAQLRYGSPNSTRVAVVLDETGPGAFDLYVDQNRNRKIEPEELVPGTGAVRRVPLQVELVQKEI